MKPVDSDLPDDEHDKQRKENGRSNEVTPIQRHRDGVAEGLSERRCRDLDYPEDKCDFGNFAPMLLNRMYH
jgi:hypothetical protein